MPFFENEQAFWAWTRTIPPVFFVRTPRGPRDDGLELATAVQGPYYQAPHLLILRVALPARLERGVRVAADSPYRVLRQVTTREHAQIALFLGGEPVYAAYLRTREGAYVQGSTIQLARAALEQAQRATTTRRLPPL